MNCLLLYRNVGSATSEKTDTTTSTEQPTESNTENKQSNTSGEEEASKSSEYGNAGKILDILRGDITIKLLSEFLFRKNRSDMQILKITKVTTSLSQ